MDKGIDVPIETSEDEVEDDFDLVGDEEYEGGVEEISGQSLVSMSTSEEEESCVESLPETNVSTADDLTEDSSTSIESTSPGYTLVWDNVGKMVKASHQSTERQNKMMLWALAYATENRIPTCHLQNENVKLAEDIPLECFLPMHDDLVEIKNRMQVIVSRILVEELPFFNRNFSTCIQKHIRHQFWRQSSKRSNVINLGVCQENPSTTAGTIKILENLHQYVPKRDDEVFKILCYGDGLSCERHNDAHMARSNGATKADKLQGLVPQVQEFHKRMLLMQDLMDIFFSGSSATDKGTLFHLKNVFGHKSVKKDVGETFNHTADFIRFVTYGYTLLAAMEVTGMKSIDDEPVDMSAIVKKQKYIETVSRKVVDLVWLPVDVGRVIHPDTTEATEGYAYCTCKQDLGDDIPMIECSGIRCPGNNWFHLECLELDQDDVPDTDFFCSDGCKKRKEYKYCCNVDMGENEPMVACDSPECQIQWFHFKCRGLKAAPRGRWYCSKACSKKKSQTTIQEDHKLNYVSSLTYMGLLDMVRKDAVRENDGKAMMSHWRLDMTMFHNKHHPKYVLLGHRLLAGVAGWLPQRLQKDSIWNRTVNLSGGPGRNLEADLVNEFLNKEFKESLKDARGNISEETIHRHSQMVGSMGKVLDKVFTEAADLTEMDFTRKVKVDITADLHTFVKILYKEQLFKKVPGRAFKAFQDFVFTLDCQQPTRLRKKLMELSKRLDKIRRCCT